MSSHTLRRAVPADLPVIVALDALSLGNERRVWIERALAHRETHLLERDGEAVAYGVLGEFMSHPFVEMVYVTERARRAGAGEALLRHLADVAPTEKVWTSTNLSNAPMHALLRKLGWQVSGMLDHLDENDPEVFYVRLPR